jgi:SAM-dependent methyltransferase
MSPLSSSLTRRERCRLCDSPRLERVLPIAASPIGDAYVPQDRLDEPQACYPLDLYLCHDCGHVQNVDVVNPEILFRDYTYKTSSSLGLVEHYRAYANEVTSRFAVPQDALALEIGSNDGSLLGFFKSHGMRVLGVDPAREIAEATTRRGIPTVAEFFGSTLAKQLREEYGPASIVAANNVFAHADDLADVVRGIHTMLAPNGVFVFEVSYLPDIVDRFLFDTVYHEHVSYHSIGPLARFFDRLDMQIFDIERIASKGGSIRGFAQRKQEGRHAVSQIVTTMIDDENRRGFTDPQIYRSYGAAIDERKSALAKVVDTARAQGKRVAGYGASTTVTTLMWHFELTQKLDFLADDNPVKQGLFAPVCHIPVLPSDELYTRKPDYVVILAWNYAEPIMKRHQRYLDEGGTFVIPLPELRVVSAR